MTDTISPPSNPTNPFGQSGALTPELVKKIADKVYALMQAEMKTKRERRYPSPQKSRIPHGGRHGT